MTMPKGFKSEHGYATVTSVEGALDYRRIAEKMTEGGYKMNHSTARNIFLSAMRKIASEVVNTYDLKSGDDIVDKAAKDPRFQEGIFEIMDEIDYQKNVDHSDIEI